MVRIGALWGQVMQEHEIISSACGCEVGRLAVQPSQELEFLLNLGAFSDSIRQAFDFDTRLASAANQPVLF